MTSPHRTWLSSEISSTLQRFGLIDELVDGTFLSYLRTNSGKHLRGVEYAGIVWTTYTIPKHQTNERVYIYIYIYIV